MTGLEEKLPLSAAMVFKVNKKFLNKVAFEKIGEVHEARLTKRELHHGIIPTTNPEIAVTTAFTYRPTDVDRLRQLEEKGNIWARKTISEAKKSGASDILDNVYESYHFTGGKWS